MLHEIGISFSTDKATHVYNNKSYLHIYETYFKDIKDKNLNILEIGISSGGSLRTWKEYFKNSKIYGLDINPACSVHAEDRIDVTIGSQSDPYTIAKILEKCGGKIDIIIDDGAHINELTAASFKLLKNSVNPGGFYVIEDLDCSYINEIHLFSNTWPGMSYNNNYNFKNNRKELDDIFNGVIRDMDMENYLTDYVKEKYVSQFSFIHFYPRLAIMKKKD